MTNDFFFFFFFFFLNIRHNLGVVVSLIAFTDPSCSPFSHLFYFHHRKRAWEELNREYIRYGARLCAHRQLHRWVREDRLQRRGRWCGGDGGGGGGGGEEGSRGDPRQGKRNKGSKGKDASIDEENEQESDDDEEEEEEEDDDDDDHDMDGRLLSCSFPFAIPFEWRTLVELASSPALSRAAAQIGAVRQAADEFQRRSIIREEGSVGGEEEEVADVESELFCRRLLNEL